MSADSQLFEHPSGLAGARDRHETIGALTAAVLARCFGDRLRDALVLSEEALHRLTTVEVYFAADERSLDNLIAAAAVVHELCARQHHPERLRAAALLDSAIVIGEEALRRLADVDVRFSPAEHAFDRLVRALSVLKALADLRDRPKRALPGALLDIFKCRILLLVGEDGRLQRKLPRIAPRRAREASTPVPEPQHSLMGPSAKPKTAAARLAVNLPDVLACIRASPMPAQHRADLTAFLPARFVAVARLWTAQHRSEQSSHTPELCLTGLNRPHSEGTILFGEKTLVYGRRASRW